MNVATLITKLIDRLYVKPIESIISRELFRYGVCGGANMMLDAIWYFLIFHYVVNEQFTDLGFVVISPHILSLFIVFPLTFLTGFWLNRHVAFRAMHQPSGKQLARYALSVLGAIIINYVCMKLFVEHLGIWPTPSKFLTTVISVSYSFLASKYFTFRKAS